ncbi:MAG: peptidoglycan DD-metalloendopeptidase family protein [Gammaproteobacteria bacterium]|nr:peptidoglycan DD-metalloendopeptidase family protein [Gammaproteobacteria bacterium]
MIRQRRQTNPNLGLYAALVFLLSLIFFSPAHAVNVKQDQARLQQLRARIETLQQTLNETRGKRDVVREEVRDLERRIGDLLNGLRLTDQQLQADEKKLQDLKNRAARERANLLAHQQQLARQIYTAYVSGRQEYPKLLLNQEDPAAVSRVLVYYGYLNRRRTERIESTRASLTQVEILESQIQKHSRELATLYNSQREQKAAWEVSRTRRNELLASLNREVRGQGQEIERLHADEKRLEQLLAELKTALPQTLAPPEGAAHFAKWRGRLSLPTQGQIVARYGTQKSLGQLKWRGLLISGREGQNVISVFPGRVVYADWLRGFGLLLILEHGDGYMTLYGHNQSLRKGIGDRVEAGEIIASLGNTGDAAQPGLYFEIRQNGEPRDPLIWCKAR